MEQQEEVNRTLVQLQAASCTSSSQASNNPHT
jgi:hypothetical protein